MEQLQPQQKNWQKPSEIPGGLLKNEKPLAEAQLESLQPEVKAADLTISDFTLGLLKNESPISRLPSMEAKRKMKADIVYDNVMAIWSVIWAISASASRLRRAALAAKRSGKSRAPSKK